MNKKIFMNKSCAGFTLVESLISLAFISTFLSFGLLQGTESYVRALKNTDTQTILLALEHARSEAMNGVCIGTNCTSGTSHGVYLSPLSATVFQGDRYSDRSPNADEQISLSGIQPDSINREVVFYALSGNVSSSTHLSWLTSNNPNSNQVIHIDKEGQLNFPVSANP